ncbi:hypothetical protein CTI14_41130, partial [Methylobacterium radiotolerans]
MGELLPAVQPGVLVRAQQFQELVRPPLGVVDGRKAIAYSCNPWYYHSAAKVSPGAYSRELKSRLTELGYFQKTGIELIGGEGGQRAQHRRLHHQGGPLVPRDGPEKWGNFSLPCNPVYWFGRSSFKNWSGRRWAWWT